LQFYIPFIKEELLKHCVDLETQITGDEMHYNQIRQRLAVVREERSKGFSEEHNQADIDEADLLSDTTSMRSSQFTSSSRGTGKTFRSAKNRRKHERKLLSLKPGNPFEDIALIDRIYNLIQTTLNRQEHVHDICKALLEVDKYRYACDLQHKLKNFLQLIKDTLNEIWIEEMCTTIQQQMTGPNIDYAHLKKEQRYALMGKCLILYLSCLTLLTVFSF